MLLASDLVAWMHLVRIENEPPWTFLCRWHIFKTLVDIVSERFAIRIRCPDQCQRVNKLHVHMRATICCGNQSVLMEMPYRISVPWQREHVSDCAARGLQNVGLHPKSLIKQSVIHGTADDESFPNHEGAPRADA